MDKKLFKDLLALYAKGMVNKWFDSNTINDNICKALAYTMILVNIDKYDSYLDYICDCNGKVCITDFLDALINNYIPYQLDLTKYNIPFLPNKILLIGKLDIQLFKNMCMQNTHE